MFFLAVGSFGSALAQYSFQEAFPGMPSFSFPVELANARDGSNRLFIVEQRGLIYVIEATQGATTRKVFLDLRDRVSQTGGETGLLGLAFHPNYVTNGYFYVDYTSSLDPQLTSYVVRFQVSPANPDSADKSSALTLLEVVQPFENHNGGKLAFGPDGYLYVSLGDGGSGNDPQNNGQNLSVLLGKILRVDVDSTAAGLNYGIPPTNPFALNTSGYREEIYAWGLRNPWKFSFDRGTGQLWAGDVGQNAREEVDIVVSGGNYGWRLMEGTICTPGVNPSCQDTAGLIAPVWDYGRSAGDASITGGYVYRGATYPTLSGKYVYGDFVSGRVWVLGYDGVQPATNILLQDLPFSVSTFGEDNNGELFLCSYGSAGRVYRLTGPTSDVRAGYGVSAAFELEQNYPNPFNPTTVIRYQVPVVGGVRLSVYDMLGREVAVLVNEWKAPGRYEITFDATGLSSGVYVYRLTAGQYIQSRTMVLIR
jgi:glucose/arabinose dehydrogenase